MKYRIMHVRKLKDFGEAYEMPADDIRAFGLTRYMLPRGGKTIVKVWDPDKRDFVAEGVAVCSDRDNYNKKIGRLIATGRARKQLSGKGA